MFTLNCMQQCQLMFKNPVLTYASQSLVGMLLMYRLPRAVMVSHELCMVELKVSMYSYMNKMI